MLSIIIMHWVDRINFSILRQKKKVFSKILFFKIFLNFTENPIFIGKF